MARSCRCKPPSKPSRPGFQRRRQQLGPGEGQFLHFRAAGLARCEWPVLPGYAVRPSAAQWPHPGPSRRIGSSAALETTLKAVACCDSFGRARRILRRVQPEMTSALRQLVEGGVIQLTLRHRRSTGCRLANRPAGTFHPAVADFNTVKHARAHGQGIVCVVFCPGRVPSAALPPLSSPHFPALQACPVSSRAPPDVPPLPPAVYLPGTASTGCRPRKPQIQTDPIPVFQGQHIAARGHPVSRQRIASGFSDPSVPSPSPPGNNNPARPGFCCPATPASGL